MLRVYAFFTFREFPLTFSFFLFPFFFFFFFLKSIQAVHMAKEWAEDGHKQWKDEEEQRIATVGTLLVVEQRVKDHNTKLTEVGREKKSVEAELAGAKRQAEDQRQ